MKPKNSERTSEFERADIPSQRITPSQRLYLSMAVVVLLLFSFAALRTLTNTLTNDASGNVVGFVVQQGPATQESVEAAYRAATRIPSDIHTPEGARVRSNRKQYEYKTGKWWELTAGSSGSRVPVPVPSASPPAAAPAPAPTPAAQAPAASPPAETQLVPVTFSGGAGGLGSRFQVDAEGNFYNEEGNLLAVRFQQLMKAAVGNSPAYIAAVRQAREEQSPSPSAAAPPAPARAAAPTPPSPSSPVPAREPPLAQSAYCQQNNLHGNACATQYTSYMRDWVAGTPSPPPSVPAPQASAPAQPAPAPAPARVAHLDKNGFCSRYNYADRTCTVEYNKYTKNPQAYADAQARRAVAPPQAAAGTPPARPPSLPAETPQQEAARLKVAYDDLVANACAQGPTFASCRQSHSRGMHDTCSTDECRSLFDAAVGYVSPSAPAAPVAAPASAPARSEPQTFEQIIEEKAVAYRSPSMNDQALAALTAHSDPVIKAAALKVQQERAAAQRAASAPVARSPGVSRAVLDASAPIVGTQFLVTPDGQIVDDIGLPVDKDVAAAIQNAPEYQTARTQAQQQAEQAADDEGSSVDDLFASASQAPARGAAGEVGPPAPVPAPAPSSAPGSVPGPTPVAVPAAAPAVPPSTDTIKTNRGTYIGRSESGTVGGKPYAFAYTKDDTTIFVDASGTPVGYKKGSAAPRAYEKEIGPDGRALQRAFEQRATPSAPAAPGAPTSAPAAPVPIVRYLVGYGGFATDAEAKTKCEQESSGPCVREETQGGSVSFVSQAQAAPVPAPAPPAPVPGAAPPASPQPPAPASPAPADIAAQQLQRSFSAATIGVGANPQALTAEIDGTCTEDDTKKTFCTSTTFASGFQKQGNSYIGVNGLYAGKTITKRDDGALEIKNTETGIIEKLVTQDGTTYDNLASLGLTEVKLAVGKPSQVTFTTPGSCTGGLISFCTTGGEQTATFVETDLGGGKKGFQLKLEDGTLVTPTAQGAALMRNPDGTQSILGVGADGKPQVLATVAPNTKVEYDAQGNMLIKEGDKTLQKVEFKDGQAVFTDFDKDGKVRQRAYFENGVSVNEKFNTEKNSMEKYCGGNKCGAGVGCDAGQCKKMSDVYCPPDLPCQLLDPADTNPDPSKRKSIDAEKFCEGVSGMSKATCMDQVKDAAAHDFSLSEFYELSRTAAEIGEGIRTACNLVADKNDCDTLFGDWFGANEQYQEWIREGGLLATIFSPDYEESLCWKYLDRSNAAQGEEGFLFMSGEDTPRVWVAAEKASVTIPQEQGGLHETPAFYYRITGEVSPSRLCNIEEPPAEDASNAERDRAYRNEFLTFAFILKGPAGERRLDTDRNRDTPDHFSLRCDEGGVSLLGQQTIVRYYEFDFEKICIRFLNNNLIDAIASELDSGREICNTIMLSDPEIARETKPEGGSTGPSSRTPTEGQSYRPPVTN